MPEGRSSGRLAGTAAHDAGDLVEHVVLENERLVECVESRRRSELVPQGLDAALELGGWYDAQEAHAGDAELFHGALGQRDAEISRQRADLLSTRKDHVREHTVVPVIRPDMALRQCLDGLVVAGVRMQDHAAPFEKLRKQRKKPV